MHPYSVAKMVTTLAALHGRKTCLNLVAGGFKNDLLALDDQTPHDRRYDRVVEYTTILMALLRGETLTLEGEFYRVKNLKLTPPLKPELLPTVTLSGSSDAGAAAASRLGAIAVEYPKPVSDYEKIRSRTPDPRNAGSESASSRETIQTKHGRWHARDFPRIERASSSTFSR
jgi:alkanesulfonate monooxygenase